MMKGIGDVLTEVKNGPVYELHSNLPGVENPKDALIGWVFRYHEAEFVGDAGKKCSMAGLAQTTDDIITYSFEAYISKRKFIPVIF